MASNRSPFADPEQNKILPPVPSSVLVTRGRETMGSQPVAAHQPPASLSAENPFADPSRETHSSRAATTTPFLPVSQPAGSSSTSRRKYSHARTAARDFTIPATSDSKSTESAAPSSSRGVITTPVSSNNVAATHTLGNENPFVDPESQTRVQDQGHVRTAPGPQTLIPRSIDTPIYDQYTTPTNTHNVVPAQSGNNSPAPPQRARDASRKLGSNRGASTAARREVALGLQNPSNSSSKSLSMRQAVALDSARRQDALLDIERARASGSEPTLNEDYLRPSPSTIRIVADLLKIREAKDVYHSHIVLTSTPFWCGIVFATCGLVSTTAAVVVIIIEKQIRPKATMGDNRVFWLVISLSVVFLGYSVSGLVWFRKKGVGFLGGDENIFSRLACDEVGLLDRANVGHLEMGNLDAVAGRRGERIERTIAATPQESYAQRQGRPMPSVESLGSARTSTTDWPSIDPPSQKPPQELSKSPSWETIGDTPVRRGAYGLHKDSNLDRNYNEQRSKRLPRESHSKPRNQPVPSSARFQKAGAQHSDEPTRSYENRRVAPRKEGDGFETQKIPTLTRSDISWPLQSSSNGQPFVSRYPEYQSYETLPPASSQGLPKQFTGKITSGKYIPLNVLAGSSNSSNSINTEPNNRTYAGAESRVEVLSPLSTLTQTVRNVSHSSLPVQRHSEIIHDQQVASEERVRSLRRSLDQSRSSGHSVRGDLSRVQSNTPSATTERLQAYVEEVEDDSDEEEERVGRPRSRSVHVVLENASTGRLPFQATVEDEDAEGYDLKSGEVVVNGNDHFRVKEQPRGRSLGKVVSRKMAELKEAGVESDRESALAPKTPPIPPKSPLREHGIFVVGDDTPTKTPAKIGRSSPGDSPSQNSAGSKS